MHGRLATVLACLMLAACAGKPARVALAPGVTEDAAAWQASMTAPDAARLAALAEDWAKLRARLPAKLRAAQGRLADPAAALPLPTLSPGSYRCRLLRLRAAPRGPATARRGTADFCYVSAVERGFAITKQTGAEPIAGSLEPDGDRYVFLGARQRRAGDNSLVYGAEAGRNLVGTLQRIGNFRWRLAIPGATAAQIDILELTPVPTEQQPAE
jgi:hypothetical protein